ncbi:MAG: S8 family peptidase [Armatimonadetes bacterium]|nr:S8 family peptidase [Armatimonadota bacterium]
MTPITASIPAPAKRFEPLEMGLNLIIQSDVPDDLNKVRQELFESGSDHNHLTAELPLINGMAIQVDARELGRFLGVFQDCERLRVYQDSPITIPQPIPEDDPGLRLDTGIPSVGADRLWEQGLTGKGVTVAVVDTGIAPHPDVKNRILAFHDVVNGRTEPYDDNGHGTHVAGIAAGDGAASEGVWKGAAPDAGLVGIKVLSASGRGSFSDIIQGIQWAVENREKYGIRVLSMSLGGRVTRSYRDDPVAQAVEKAAEAGLVPVVAAGNEGPYIRSVSTPGHALHAITVGADDDQATRDPSDDRVATFSSRGPTRIDDLVKPDVVAPGVKITSADHTSNGYTSKSGTSMATPMVAGVVAQLLQARPDATPESIKEALMATAHRLANGDNNTQGAGLIDAVEAHRRLTTG